MGDDPRPFSVWPRGVETMPSATDSSDLLFAYGTLAPWGEAADRRGWAADAVRGRLFDLGPYPGLIDLDGVGTDWVEGFVRVVTPEELAGPLDRYEGVAEGLYRRAVTTTRAGRRVWVYVYARALPAGALGPLTRWSGPRGPY